MPPGITLNESTVLKARLFNNGEWSALAETTFLVGTLADASNLVVSEIFYQPAGSSEDLEFLELQNISAASIELGGVQFSAGIDFTFSENTQLAPGARILVVRNLVAFETEYGTGLPIAGEFQNETGLSNSGEQITILANDGSLIKDFEYDDQLPWPSPADSDGHSLVLIDPGANPDHNDPTSWRASNATGGNPAASDSTTFSGGDLLNYALGDLPRQLEIVPGNGSLNISYAQMLSADDAIISAEWSTDLDTWTPLGSEFDISDIEILADGRQLVTLSSSTAPIIGETTLFLRLSVTLR